MVYGTAVSFGPTLKVTVDPALSVCPSITRASLKKWWVRLPVMPGVDT